MKKLLLTLLISLSLCSTAWATDYTQDVNCVVAYLFKEGSGTTVDNAEGTAAYDGDLTGHSPNWAVMSGTNAPAYADYMLDFTDVGDYLATPDGVAVRFTSSFSLCSWVKFDSTDATSDDVIIAKTPGDASTGYFFVQHVGTTKIDLGFYNTAWKVVAGVTSIGTTNWGHVAGIFDDTNNLLEVYVNGVSDATLTNVTVNPITNNEWVEMGSESNSTSKTLDGKLGELGLFSDILSSTEINDIMDNGLAGSAAARRIIFIH